MSWRPRHELLASPIFIAAIALLLLNDRVLKAAWPGWITGKLSDIAGVAMIAMLLTAITGWRTASFALTGILFTLLKTLPSVAVAAAPVLGGVTRTDPSDAVVAIIGLVPLWYVVGSGREVDPPRGSHVVGLRVVAVGVAVFATTATSCGPSGVSRIVEYDGDLYATASSGAFISSNAGATWKSVGLKTYEDPLINASVAPCAGRRCFEIRQDGSATQVVETTQDGDDVLLTWTRQQASQLAKAVDWSCGDGSFNSVSAYEHAGETVVIVSMSEAGTLRWTSGTQQWVWVAVGPWGVAADTVADIPVALGPSTEFWSQRWVTVGVAALGLIAAIVGVYGVARVARWRRRKPTRYCVLAALGAAFAAPGLGAALLLTPGSSGSVAPVTALLIALAPSGAIISLAAALAARPNRGLPPADGSSRVG